MFEGERLAELRKDKGLSQKQLANELNIGFRTLQAYERNQYSPSDKVQEQFAKYFNISLDYLHGLVDVEFPLTKERYIILPKNFTKEFKQDLIEHIDFVKYKHNMK